LGEIPKEGASMAVGRISGPLLAKNLFRDDIPLAFYNRSSTTESPILYLDVVTGQIGIKTDAPSYTLDVAGFVNSENLRVVETEPGTGVSTLGKIVIQSGTITTVMGPIDIQPSANDNINLRSNVAVYGNLHATGNITADGDIKFGNTSTDVVVFDAEIASDLIPKTDNTYKVGNDDATWAEGYFNNLYTHIISNSTGSVRINPGSGLTEIIGDLKVSGSKPLGTAPVVTNVLYVTEDGSDTNDGRAQDPSRACRTISGAVKSPYYIPGTSIKVSPGHYLEQNPILMQPYTSIIGSDLRTTVIEPINKTQDLFHLQNGCYLAQMLFLNGRSGLLPIESASGFNRGAYCTAFPPQVGGQKIDVYHSPYIQNCTNQSGPWLVDGTLFVPNQTVQVPTAVGTGSWEAGTSTIVVTLTTGTINPGDSINEGPQSTGFFDARTLMLANVPFLQEQVIGYIDEKFSTSTFVYDVNEYQDNINLLVDAIGIDLLQNSDSDSVFAGLQYWEQSGYIDGVADGISTITNAVTYLRDQCVSNGFNDPGYDSGSSPAALSTIIGLFNTINGILQNGTQNVNDLIQPNGLPSTVPAVISMYNYLLSIKSTLVNDTITYINTNNPGFEYDEAVYRTNFSNMIDSVIFDMLRGGNKQSIKTAVYYYNYQNVSKIDGETQYYSAAYNYIKTIIPAIVKAETLTKTFQPLVTQVTNLPAATDEQAQTLRELINTINSIMRNGPDTLLPSGFAPEKSSVNLEFDDSQVVLNAYALLQANKEFIRAEAIAYVNNTQINFTYSREKCARDVRILIENLSYDVAFGGNQKSVESGLAYYDGVISLISGQENQTVAAIDYLSELSKQVIANTTVTNLYPGSASQVINIVLDNGSIAEDSYENAFNIVTNIILNGPTAAPPIVISSGPDSQVLSAEVLLQSNRSFIQSDVINYINNQYSTLVYDESKCYRDVGLIVDSLAVDLLFSTSSQSIFAGIQYWNQGSSVIPSEVTATVQTFAFVRDLAKQVVVNDISGVRYSSGLQDTSLPAASSVQADTVGSNFDLIIDILENGTASVTDRIVPNRLTPDLNFQFRQAYDLIQVNRAYIQDEAIAFINATLNPGLLPNYDETKCRRDVGYILDSISFDLLYGGNKQSIQAGVSYYGYTGNTAIPGEITATIAAYNYIKTLVNSIVLAEPVAEPYQKAEKQIINMSAGTTVERSVINANIDVITQIIQTGPDEVELLPISLQASTSTTVVNAAEILLANRKFIQAETVAYINQFYAFSYNTSTCYRDAGLIVDAITYDLILGGNAKTIEAGISYFRGTQSVIDGQIIQTVDAINHIKQLAVDIISNTPTAVESGNLTKQSILPFYQGGGLVEERITNNFNTLVNIITNGPELAPEKFLGTGLFAVTGVNPGDILLPNRVGTVTGSNPYTITLVRGDNGQTAYTVGDGNNATLYFGKTNVFPMQDNQVEAMSLQYTGNATTWNQRKVDRIGAMGGSLVDGAVVSERSPINSFVYDAFTQVAQGGRGVHITNNGYAQLVSVFTIFCSIGVQVDNGGIASITNSNSNFGDICLLSKGYGKLKFSGTIYNPKFQIDIVDPATNTYSPGGFSPFYPQGFYPDNANVKVFVPDTIYRPHIGLIMEVEPPTGYINQQNFPGFLTAATSVNSLTTGSLTITGVDTRDIAIGNAVYARNFTNSSQRDSNGVLYVDTGTVVVDVGYQTVYLNKPLTSGGGDFNNPFDLYFCGNAYYTVMSSTTSTTTTSNETTYGSRLIPDEQVAAEIDVLGHVEGLVLQIVENQSITLQPTTTGTQYIDELQDIGPSGQVQQFISERFSIVIDVLTDGENSTYVTEPNGIQRTGTIPLGAAAAVNLIENNYELLADDAISYININYPTLEYDVDKCRRDIKLIARQIVYDIKSGGNYYSVYAGLSYWARPGTYHVVSLENQVRDPILFPDGSIVNWYQRSYISALGYTLEYVGAGITYGSLPQVGVADPVQSKETVQLNNGKIFFTSTDQNGDFRIGPDLVISQATGTLRGRTFSRSLFAEMTPFILAVESGGD
jgi:hypothetical protein